MTSHCEIFDLATHAICTRNDVETVTARCKHGHTSTKRACELHGEALRTGGIGCRACSEAGHHCDMVIEDSATAPEAPAPRIPSWITYTVNRIISRNSDDADPEAYPRVYAHDYLRRHADEFGIPNAEYGIGSRDVADWLCFQLGIKDAAHRSDAYAAVLATLADAYLRELGRFLPDDVKAARLRDDAAPAETTVVETVPAKGGLLGYRVHAIREDAPLPGGRQIAHVEDYGADHHLLVKDNKGRALCMHRHTEIRQMDGTGVVRLINPEYAGWAAD